MRHFKAWYRTEREGMPADRRYPDWVVFANDADDATGKILARLERPTPERGYKIFLEPVPGEDEGIILFASARQTGQAID